MNRHRLVRVTAFVMVAGLAWAGDEQGGRPLHATLTGAAEVPGPGDPDGTGTAELRLNLGQGQICYDLQVSGIDRATGAHIHQGAAGVAGPVVVPLAPPSDGSSADCVSASRDLIKAIIQNPADYYVNVHNGPYPQGAVRGQLTR
jgi:hypothetical protein